MHSASSSGTSAHPGIAGRKFCDLGLDIDGKCYGHNEDEH